MLTDRNCARRATRSAAREGPAARHPGRHQDRGHLSGPRPYLLDDASLIILPPKHAFGADHEIIDGIGVAPDYYLPVTAQDLSTGHDPDIAKALTLLGG